MCGIIFGRRSDDKPIFKNVFKRYLQQSHRGDEGFGYIAIKDGKVKGVKRFQNQDEVQQALAREDSSEILFHHRYPTSTPNFAELNHPITVKNRKFDSNYYVVHNGVLSNEETLRTKHEQEGYKYTTVYQEWKKEVAGKQIIESLVEEKFNDSESLAIDLALYLEGHKTTIDSIGTIAFICIQTDKKNNIQNIYYGRNEGNPLIVEQIDTTMLFIKSEGQGTKIDSDIIYCEDYKTHALTEIDINVGKLYSYSGYSGYSGYNTRTDSNQTGYNTHLNLPKVRTPYDYDDEDVIEPYIETKYGNYKVGVPDEWEEEDQEYACYRMEEIDAELATLYEQKQITIDMINEWKEQILLGRQFDASNYDLSMIEKEKEETTLDSITKTILELEDEALEIYETMGIESAVVEFVDNQSELLDSYKDVK